MIIQDLTIADLIALKGYLKREVKILNRDSKYGKDLEMIKTTEDLLYSVMNEIDKRVKTLK